MATTYAELVDAVNQKLQIIVSSAGLIAKGEGVGREATPARGWARSIEKNGVEIGQMLRKFSPPPK